MCSPLKAELRPAKILVSILKLMAANAFRELHTLWTLKFFNFEQYDYFFESMNTILVLFYAAACDIS